MRALRSTSSISMSFPSRPFAVSVKLTGVSRAVGWYVTVREYETQPPQTSKECAIACSHLSNAPLLRARTIGARFSRLLGPPNWAPIRCPFSQGLGEGLARVKGLHHGGVG